MCVWVYKLIASSTTYYSEMFLDCNILPQLTTIEYYVTPQILLSEQPISSMILQNIPFRLLKPFSIKPFVLTITTYNQKMHHVFNTQLYLKWGFIYN
jgi:hypothetical protein